jgi:hypothetical protein
LVLLVSNAANRRRRALARALLDMSHGPLDGRDDETITTRAHMNVMSKTLDAIVAACGEDKAPAGGRKKSRVKSTSQLSEMFMPSSRT